MKFAAAIAALTAGFAAAQGNWTVIAQNLGTFSTGVSFNADGKTGYLVTDANGSGANIMKSTDGGNTWQTTNDAFELMPLDVTSFGSNIASIGALVIGEYSNNAGASFNTSTLTNTAGGAGQCIRNLGAHDAPTGFIMVGDFGLFTQDNGVAVSNDFGKTYVAQNITNLVTEARYGAFPSATTWYVSAGEWPDSGNDQPTTSGTGSPTTAAGEKAVVRPLTGKVSVVKGENGHTLAFNSPAGSRVSGRSMQSAPTGQYVAQVMKSTDAGKTWSSVFLKYNWAYLNGMDCLDENRCCAGAENDDTGGGAYVICTQDGGNTWNTTLTFTVDGGSVLDLRVVGTDGYWAVGGVAAEIGGSANFWYSGDAGASWTMTSTIPNVYASSVDCAQGTQECWSTLLDVLTQEASLAYASTI